MDELQFSPETTLHLVIVLPLLLQLMGLSFAVLVDSYMGRTEKRVSLLIFALALSLILQNQAELGLAEAPRPSVLRVLVSVYGYSVRPLILLLLFYLVEPQGRYWPGWILVGANALLHGTALFSPLVFYFTAENHYQGGPLNNACLAVSLILLAWLLRLTLRRQRQSRGREIWLALTVVPMILASLILDSRVGLSPQPVTFLTVAVVSSCLLYYLWAHLRFVRAREGELRDRQRDQLMLTQIKPHFLYNVLGAIEALCDTDPKAAKAATVRFSRYLRSNLSAISAEELIPFERELAHTKLYLELEQYRFEDALQVVYQTEYMDFFLPPLTLEPLAENAVRHGVRGKADGRGTVTIRSRELTDCYELSVRDDGPGFEPSALPQDGRGHIGIQNVRARLNAWGGSLELKSAPGRGTEAIIRLPKQGRGAGTGKGAVSC